MKKVFVVEDDESLLNVYKTELQLSGYNVVSTSVGGDASKKIKVAMPDIVLLDIMLPDKNGIEILAEIKGDPETASIPVIMLTNFGNEDFVKKALEGGAEDYLLKHKIEPSEITAKIKTVIKG